MAKQMEFLCTQAGYDRLQHAERRLSAGLYRQSSDEHSPNGLTSDSAEGQGTSWEGPAPSVPAALGTLKRNKQKCAYSSLSEFLNCPFF